MGTAGGETMTAYLTDTQERIARAICELPDHFGYPPEPYCARQISRQVADPSTPSSPSRSHLPHGPCRHGTFCNRHRAVGRSQCCTAARLLRATSTAHD
ncbi:hypothetical protein ACWGCW_05770 [Streptomyces sp. NPDC054933]